MINNNHGRNVARGGKNAVEVKLFNSNDIERRHAMSVGRGLTPVAALVPY